MRTRSYNSFWKQIHDSAKEENFPLRVMFELTYRCNFKCKHCYLPQSYRRKGGLKTKEIFSILDQLKDIGCFYLGFTGGEPFIRNDIIEILRYAREKGFQMIVYTNGSLINQGIAQELHRLKINKLDITIPAMRKKSFERISGVAGSRNRVFKTIDILHKNRVNLGFKTCVLKDNASEIKEIEDFSTSLGAPHRLDDSLFRRLDGSEEPYRYRGKTIARMVKQSGLKEDFSDACDLKITGYENNNGNLFACGAGLTQAAITPQGELKLCLMIDHPRYNILESSLKECWQRLNRFQRGIALDKDYQCSSCSLKAYCKRCPARSWLYNRSFTSCAPESRAKAQLVSDLFSRKS
ncbi:radical SAM protein [Candidatus Omnitrophota bacterium]